MAFTHVHIGAGLFGLGMVVDLCGQAGFESIVFNRDSQEPHHQILRRDGRYRVVYDGNPSTARSITARFHYYRGDSDLEAIRLISDPSVGLLTTSVTPDGLSGIASLVARAIEVRTANAAPPLCVMACENLSNNSRYLAELVKPHLHTATTATGETCGQSDVLFCNTVVDRVCNDIIESNGSVEIAAESYREWIIEPPPVELDSISKLMEVPGVSLVHGRAEREAYEIRKYWCLNGIHIAAAAYGYNYDRNLDLLSEALAIPDILKKVRALQADLGLAFRFYAESAGVIALFPEAEVRQYNENVLARFRANTKERVARLLKHQETIDKTIEEFISSIVEPDLTDVIDAAQAAIRDQKEWTLDLKRDLRQKLIGILQDKLGETLRLLDIHEFLDRVIDRIVQPQRQLILGYQQTSDTCPRLELDDALQTIVTAMHRYARGTYEKVKRGTRGTTVRNWNP